VSLASLFMAAAQPIPSDAEGASRARSASEAFLYRRLERLEDTRRRFRLNVELAIPFDGNGRMEVDLLCEDSHLAIEVDGALHLDKLVVINEARGDRQEVLLSK
jgi:very-short-patch-repair endonuclease